MAKAKAISAKGKTLVIVESPAKAKTINKYLGPNFVVKASMGHVRDLPDGDLGIDINNDFKPVYEVVGSRLKAIRDLRKLADSATSVVLATDRDREGEAIAWHLVEALNLDPAKVSRVIFNEITKSAIAAAFDQPHEIDMDCVNAQQARRILDRIVGYQLSPLLWRKVAKGLSAGRVQSVAARLIVDREREIRAFVPEESWKIAAFFTGTPEAPSALSGAWQRLQTGEPTQKAIQTWLSSHSAFKTELTHVGDKPFGPKDAEAAKVVAEALGFDVRAIERHKWDEYEHLDLEQATIVGSFNPSRAAKCVVSDLTTKRTTTRAPGPFTTATLQQSASTRLGFATSRTMRVAQSLYEGIDLGDGPVGLITYMRTDSTNIAGEAVAAVRGFVSKEYGAQYVPAKPNVFGKRQARAQEAHEAIRPTDVTRTPASMKGALDPGQMRLYELIWKRFVACQMPAAEWDSTSITVACDTSLGAARFSGNGRKLVFDGFMKVAGVSSEDQILPALATGGQVGLLDLQPRQQWTSPPPRFTEASLVKAMESDGIGRPSTYASIIDTIQRRGYVDLEDRKFFASALGEVVTDKLVGHFPQIMDIKFTSYMEDELDKIEEAHLDWVHVLHEFYDPFRELLERAGAEMEAVKAQPSAHKCPQCGSEMVYRWSKNGRFLSCSNYPDCKAALNVNRKGDPLLAGEDAPVCEECGKAMVIRQSRGSYFLGCSGYPECRSTRPCDENGVPLQQVSEEELSQPCDACGEGMMVVKWKRMRAFLGCDRYPKCKNTGKVPDGIAVKRKPAPPPEEAGVACEKCDRPMLIREGPRGKFIACSGYPKCRNSKPVEKLEELKQAMIDAGKTVRTLAEVEAQAKAGKASSSRKKVDIAELGEPPAGFAWTRTGRPVVETLPEEGTLKCPDCRNIMHLKRGRFGPFFSCTGFPKCRFVSNLRGQAKKDAEELMPAPAKPKPIPTDISCEDCGAMMSVREGRTGRFLGCSAYPKCKATAELPAGFVVPEPEAVGSSA
jgi:DNA topoisomerase-1